MKWILVLFFIGSFSARAANKVEFNLDHSPEIIKNLISPIWKEIPYTHTWRNKYYGHSDETVSVEIIQAKIKLGNKGAALVDIVPFSKNLIDLNWRLNDINIDGLIRVHFKFKKYGIKISHSEDFNLQGRQINSAKSRVNLSYFKDRLRFKIDHNKGFKFKRVSISPKNGIGKTLRWIFENVFSKNEVDQFVADKVNSELIKWANSKNLLNDIERVINKELVEFQKNKIRLGDLSTNLLVNVNDFTVDEKSISIASDISFDNQDRKVHICAKDLVQDFVRRQNHTQVESGDVTVSHPLIENALINFSAYEIFNDQGELIEPLFCFGYQEFDKNGEPVGKNANIDLGIGSINFKYWVQPLDSPSFIYQVDNNEILVAMKFGLDLKNQYFPRVRVDNGPLSAGVLIGFSPKYVPNKGLVLEFTGLEITGIAGGDLQVQWFPFLPYRIIDVSKYEENLEKILNREISGSLENDQLIVVEEELFVSEKISLELQGHELRYDHHKVKFDLILK